MGHEGAVMVDIVTLFCEVDDFYKIYEVRKQKEINDGKITRNRQGFLTKSEIMTILIFFHSSNYRNFKYYYLNLVSLGFKKFFPNLISYNRFVEITSSVLVELCCFLSNKFEPCSGISFVDATKIVVCNNKRISRNKVFKDIAKIGKSTMGWFFGFKLHLIVNEKGGLVAAKITPGNIDDRKPLPEMVEKLFGKLFGDKGYISKELFENLLNQGLTLVTGIKKNMKNKLIPMIDKILLRKRSIIETINDQLKNISQIEHTRHRSFYNFMVNAVCALISYTFRDKKPSISGVWREEDDFVHENMLLIPN